MTRLDEIRQRHLIPYGITTEDIDYLLSRVERLEGALKRIRDVTQAKDDYITSYIASEALTEGEGRG